MQPWDTPRAAGAGADRAALLQGTAGHLHPITVKDSGEGSPICTCLWDLAGGFLSGMWVWVAGMTQVQVQSDLPVTHSSAHDRGHELVTYIPNHPFNWRGPGSIYGCHCNFSGLETGILKCASGY